MQRFHLDFDDNPSDLKQLMTAAPMKAEDHAAIMRKKVEARRANEDALEASRKRRDPLSDI